MVRLSKSEKIKVAVAGVLIALIVGAPVVFAATGGWLGAVSRWVPSLVDWATSIEGGVGGDGYAVRRTKIDDPIDMNETFSASSVKKLDVAWNGGELRIKQGAGDEVVVRARIGAGVYDMDPRQASIRLDDATGALIVDDGLPKSDNGRTYPPFELTIELPSGLALDAVDVSGTSASMAFDRVACDELDVSTVSGDVSAREVDTGHADIVTVSGAAAFSGASSSRLSIKSVSGALNVALSGSLPPNIELNSTSGEISLDVPDDADFTLTSDRVSGGFSSELGEVTEDGTSARVVSGSGTCQIAADSVSGAVRVH